MSAVRTQPLGTAEDIQVVGNEDGWELIIHTQDGAFVVNIHAIAESFLANANDQIGEWLEEGGRARAERRHDAEQADAYDLRNPKSSGYHDRMSAIYDEREGK